MARLLKRWLGDPTECAYLPSEEATLEYRLMLDVTADDLEVVLARGWRRFGPAYFRPRCAQCSSCVPLRVPVERFRPSRSQRRVMAKTRHLRAELGSPRVDRTRLALYDRWHRERSDRRGWEHDEMDPEQYFHQFAFPHPAGRELALYDGSDLVAVSILDETPRSLSAVYTFFEPELAPLSLGTAVILRQIEYARGHGKSWVYLGYRVRGCPSSEYKARFRPHELMTVWPRGTEPGTWSLVESPGIAEGREASLSAGQGDAL